MTNRYFDSSSCEVIYKSPKGVRKWFSLKEYYRTNHERTLREGSGVERRVRLAISISSGRWEQLNRSFASLDEAMDTIEGFEDLGVRVEAYDSGAPDTSEDC